MSLTIHTHSIDVMKIIKVQGQSLDPLLDSNASPDTLYTDLVTLSTEQLIQLKQNRDNSHSITLSKLKKGSIIELVFEGGITQWMRPDELEKHLINKQDNSRNKPSSRSTHTLYLTPYSFIDLPNSRSLSKTVNIAEKYISKVLKFLKILNIDPVSEVTHISTEALIAHFEKRRIPHQGLLQYNGKGLTNLHPLPANQPLAINTQKPVLLFIHGMFSNTQESFGHFPDNALDQLASPYGNQVYFLEHHTLTQSPMANALLITDYFPAETRLHIIAYSRGGLVGELLCQGNLQRHINGRYISHSDIFTSVELAHFTNNPKRSKQLKELTTLADRLQQKCYRVEKLIRIASPIRGTLLAANNLNKGIQIIYNVLSLIPEPRYQGVLQFLRLVTLTLIKKRTDPVKLPGIECMRPSSPIIRLLNRPNVHLINDLTVISSELQASNWFRKAIDWMIEKTFFHEANDLIVNTAAMLGGCQRVNYHGRKVMEMRELNVHHFEYFANARIIQLIQQSIRLKAGEIVKPFMPIWESETIRHYTPLDHHSRYNPATDPTRGITSYSYPVSPSIHPTRRDSQSEKNETKIKPSLLFIPGIFGSALSVSQRPVWLDSDALSWDEMHTLRIEAQKITTNGLVEAPYQALLQSLSDHYSIDRFAWDWRKSHQEASQQLADYLNIQLQQANTNNHLPPTRILAHSNGAFLILGLIAYHPKLWKKLTLIQDFSVIFIGSPLGGSHAILQLLLQQHRLPQLLNLLSQSSDPNPLLEQFCAYPGLLELLPETDDYDYFSADFWGYAQAAIKAQKSTSTPTHKLAPIPSEKNLRAARKVHQTLLSVKLNQQPIYYLQGQAASTPKSIDLGTDYLRIYSNHEGDGFSRWLKNVPSNSIKPSSIWHIPAEHGKIMSHPQCLLAITELYNYGFSNTLEQATHISTPHTQSVIQRSPALYPDLNDLLAAAFHFSLKQPLINSQPQLSVAVIHGNLEYVNMPVVAGHYYGDSINRAEDALDRRLKGRLRELYHLGMYPGLLNTSHTLLNAGETPAGAIIVGLGSIGSLSVSKLIESYMRALLDFALESRNVIAAHLKSSDDPNHTKHYQLSIASLLLGSNTGGLSVQESMTAIVRACHLTNKQLRKDKRSSMLFIASLSFIEIYEDRAIEAAHLLQNFNQHHELSQHIYTELKLKKQSGRLKRMTYGQHALRWSRIQVSTERNGTLKYTTLTDHARTPLSIHNTQRKLVDQFINQATYSTDNQSAIGKTLFELLIPNDLKDPTYDINKLVMILDSTSARYPWELLENRRNTNNVPLAVRTGMLRQLQTTHYRKQVLNPTELSALVIGNPQSQYFSNLPAAEKEALSVADQLQRHGYEVNSQIHSDRSAKQPTAQSILTALHTADYRILHLAGHGVYRYDKEGRYKKPITGMVLGDDLFLTPTEIKQMRTVPEFAFINCCHLGKIETDPKQSQFNRYSLAANLSSELINMGVRAIIATGWAVDDKAAQLFADKIYQTLMAGRTFGDAVILARQTVYRHYKHTNTWGAYQCYGDPDYVLTQRHHATTRTIHLGSFSSYVSIDEAITELQNLVCVARSSEANTIDIAIQKAEAIIRSIPKNWQNNSHILYEQARLHYITGHFEKAIAFYQRIIGKHDANFPIKQLDRMIQVSAYRSIELLATHPDQAMKVLSDAEKNLFLMEQLGITVKNSLTPLYLFQCKAWIIDDEQARTETLNQLSIKAQALHFSHLESTKTIHLDALLMWLTSQLLLDLRLHDSPLPTLINHDPATLNYWLNQAHMKISQREQEHNDFTAHKQRAEYLILRMLLENDSQAYEFLQPIIDSYTQAKHKDVSLADIKLMSHQCQFIFAIVGLQVNDANIYLKQLQMHHHLLSNILSHIS